MSSYPLLAGWHEPAALAAVAANAPVAFSGCGGGSGALRKRDGMLLLSEATGEVHALDIASSGGYVTGRPLLDATAFTLCCLTLQIMCT